MKNRTPLWTLAVIAVLVAPFAAAQSDDEAETDDTLVRYFLNTSDGNLTLTHLAPSSGNSTQWTQEFNGRYDDGLAIDLSMPAPFYELNETAGVKGEFTASYTCQNSLFGYCERVDVEVQLVQGERVTRLASSYLSSYERTVKFSGDFAGHGKSEAAHTHGNGTDADRGLYSQDFLFRLVFTESSSITDPLSLGSSDYTVRVKIDGTSFADMWASGTAPLPAAARNATNASVPADNETPPSSNNTTSGNTSANGSSAAQHTLADESEPLMAVPGLGGFSALAAVAAGVGLAVRRRRPPGGAYTRAPLTF